MRFNEFYSTMWLYLTKWEYLMELEGETFRIAFYRFDPTSTLGTHASNIADIIIYPRWLIFKTESFAKLKSRPDFIKDFIEILTNQYTSKYDFEGGDGSCFSEDIDFDDEVLDQEKYTFFNINALNYFRMMGMTLDETGETATFPMMPRSSEIYMLNRIRLLYGVKKYIFPYYTVGYNALKLKMKELEEFEISLKSYSEATFAKRRMFMNQDAFEDVSELQTEVTAWNQENLNVSKIKKWFYTRHNLFAKEVCNLMDWIIPESGLDVDIINTFNYTGRGCHKTPDLVINLRNRLVIMDFKVTEGNPGTRMEETMKNYEDLRYGLAMHLGVDVDVEVAVWKINDTDHFYFPESMVDIKRDLSENETIKTLSNIYTTLSTYNSYQVLKKEVNEDDPEEEDSQMKLSLYTSLVSNFSKLPKLDDKKTVDLEVSRNPSLNTKESKSIRLTTKEQVIYKDLMDSLKIDENRYKTELTMTLIEMMNKKEIPEYLKPVLNFDRKDLFSLMDKMMEEAKVQRDKVMMDFNFKLPKVFKLPLLNFYTRFFKEMGLPKVYRYWNAEHKFDDGTLLLEENRKLEELEDKDRSFHEMGIGFDDELDTKFFDDILFFLKSRATQFQFSKTTYEDNIPEEMIPVFKQLSQTNLWSVMEFWSDLMKNICYLEGRRHFLNKREGNTVLKKFDNYMLLIRKGAKLSSEKQIRIKIIAHKDDAMMHDKEGFHTWKEFKDDLVWTKWLALSITDIKHFLKVKEVAICMASDLRDKFCENTKSDGKDFEIITNSFMSNMVILMEHKRGTSTTNQLNRYLMHSGLAYITNRKKLVKDIMAEPIRSRVESFMRISQIKWYRRILEDVELKWAERISNLTSTSTDYDRILLPSFYDLNRKVEFSEMMNEIYLGNLFDKESGFVDHRLKRIVSKMTEAEKHYLMIREEGWSRGDVTDVKSFIMSDDQFHMFDKKFVVTATKLFFNKKNLASKICDAMIFAMTETITSSMMMTSSLHSGPIKSECMDFSKKIMKDKSFITLFKEVEILSTHTLLGMLSRRELIEAIFTIFPKNQIGGPREILIQAVKLRYFVRFLEKMSTELCKLHDKEMLTKDKMKAQLQSEKMSDYKEAMILNAKKKIPSVYCSFNADSARWSPGFVVENFLYFVANWNIPDNIKDVLLAVIISFSSKELLVPDRLKAKWHKKPKIELEFDSNIQTFREMSNFNDGVVTLHSGTGQGMFHFLSSIYHCVMDDLVDIMVTDCLRLMYGTILSQTTLISSDDKTKISLFKFQRSGVVNDSFSYYTVIMDVCYRLANIHTNWKKSGFHFIITEFNSLFSIGKRMLWATLKDIYNSVSMPDLTLPDEAVTQVVSNVRRCMEHGVYLPTLKTILMVMRKTLLDMYRLDQKIINDLTEKLNVYEIDLPFQLGFVPIDMIFETLIYGPELQMFKRGLSDEVKKFYYNLHSANSQEFKMKTKKTVPHSDISFGKYWYELPSKLDKKLQKIKNDFYTKELNLKPAEVLEELEKNALNLNLNHQSKDFNRRMVLEFFVGMRRNYEFQETFVVHSLIRALQMSIKKGSVYPMSDNQTSLNHSLDLMEKRKTDEKRKFTAEEEVEMLKIKNKLKRYNMDILGFATHIMDLSPSGSSLPLLSGLERVVENKEWVEMELLKMYRVEKNSHPTMRTMRFYTNNIGMDASGKEIMEYLFNPHKECTTRVSNAFLAIVNSTGRNFNYSRVMENPFKYIREFMNNSEYPMKSFKDFMGYYHKNLRFQKINMMSDSPCSGNMKENLLNLYRTRGNPSYVLENYDSKYKSDLENRFLTEVGMKELDIESYNLDRKIISSDTKLRAAMKLLKASNGEWLNAKYIDSERIYFTYDRKRGRKLWFDFKTMATCVESKKFDFYRIFSSEQYYDEELSKQTLTLVEREMYDSQTKKKEILFETKERTMQKRDMLYSKGHVEFRVNMEYSDTKWKMMLSVRVNDSTRKDTALYFSFPIYTEKYMMNSSEINTYLMKSGDTIGDLVFESPCINWLDEILIEEGWISKSFIPEVGMEEKVPDLDDDLAQDFDAHNLEESYKIINTYNTSYGNVQLERTMGAFQKEGIVYEQDNKAEESISTAMLVADALKQSMTNAENPSEKEAVPVNQRKSVVQIIDSLITKAAFQEITLDRDVALGLFNMAKRRGKIASFHYTLIDQIKYFFRQKETDMISDGMVVILYNIIIKKMMTVVDVGVISTLKSNPNASFPEKVMMLKAKVQNDMYSDVLGFYD